MNDIIVSLMDAPTVMVDGEKKVFPYRKVEGLFYYLCLKRRITRDEAIGIFWADCDEQRARKNLRDAIYHIKKIIGTDIVTMDGNVFISINSDVHLSVDMYGVRDNILENYKGEFLKYFYIKNCFEFENWLDETRRELRELYIKAALKQLKTAGQERVPSKVLEYADKLLDVLYLDEGLYRDAMSLLLKEGEYSSAVALYQKLEAAVRQDLDAEPEAETKALMEKVLRLRKKVVEQPDREQPAFFGRQQELCEIYDCVQNHLLKREEHRTNFILISGEAGVGKTALIDYLKTILMQDQFTIFSYCCYASERDLYLKPWNDILNQMQEYCRRHRREPEGSKHLMSDDISDYKLFITQYGIHLESFLRSFCREFCTGGFVLFLDDIQWMDPSSIQQLNNLMLRLKDCPIVTVAVSRHENVKEVSQLKVYLSREGLFKEIKLKHFTFEETKELIEARSSKLLAEPGKVEAIYHYTGGNALFLTELLQMMKENEVGDNALTQGGMSARMVSIIQSRLAILSPEELELLSIMSIFPNGVTTEDLRILSSETEIRICELLELLEDHQLVVERMRGYDITYEIMHVLFKNYILSQVSAGRRRVYHKEVAKYYEKQYWENGDVNLMPVLIYHYQNAEDVYKKYLYRLEYMKIFFAGKEEIYPSVSTGITDQFFLPDLRPGENILIPLAEEIRLLPDNDKNYQELRMMVEYLIGRYDLSSGDYKKGLRNINACITAARYLKNQKYLMDSYLQMLYYAIQVYDLDMMWEYIELCGGLLKEYEFPDTSVYVVERLKALYYIKREMYEEATGILDAVIPKLERIFIVNPTADAGLPACYNYRGEIYMKQGELDDALACISKAVSCCSSKLPTAGLGISYTNIGIILYRMNDYNKASEYFNKAQKCFQNLSIQWGRTKEEAYSALLDLKLGKTKNALVHYTSACRYAGKDYSPHTKTILQDVYNQLKAIPGIVAAEPPVNVD